jgi:hypothetical protein
MNARVDETTSQADPVVRGIAVMTVAVTIVGMLALVRAAVGGRVDHVTVRVDNRAGLGVQVDALDAFSDRVGLGQADARTLTGFHEIPDIGARWTLVATYGGRQVHRATVARSDLAAANWTLTVPAGATTALERAGYR